MKLIGKTINLRTSLEEGVPLNIEEVDIVLDEHKGVTIWKTFDSERKSTLLHPIRPKKKSSVVPVTAPREVGSVGRKIFFFFF